MSWSNKYKRSINCDSPKGFSQRAHCAARKKRKRGEETKSKSPFNETYKIKPHKTVEQIAKKHRLEVSFVQRQLEMGIPIEHEHTKDKILATDIALQHLDEIPDYYTRLKKMESDAKKHHKKFKDVKENVTIENSEGKTFLEVIDLIKPDPIKSSVKEDLRNWFDPNHPDGGWKRYNTKGEAIGPCAREPGEAKPKCLSNKKAAQLRSQGGAKKIASAVKRKRKEDPVANRRGKGEKPKMVSNKINEQSEMVRYCPKCQKDETRSECKYGPSFWSLYSTPSNLTSNQMKFDIAQVHPANESKEPMDHEYSMARSELDTIVKSAKKLQKKFKKGEGEIEAWVQSKITKAADYVNTASNYIDSGEMSKEEFEYLEENNKPTNPSLWSKAKSLAKQKFDVYPSAYANGWAAKWYKSKGGGWKSVSEACWDGYEQQGMKKKGKKMVPNCVKKEEYSNWREDFIFEGWEDKIRNMSPKQIEDLKKANPGAAGKIDAMVKKASSATPNPVGRGPQMPQVPKKPQSAGMEVTRADVSGRTRAAQAAASGSTAYKPGVGVTKDFKLDPNFKTPKSASAVNAAREGGMASKLLKLAKNPKVAIPLAIAGGVAGLMSAPKKGQQQKEDYSNWREELGLTELLEDWQKVNRQDKTDGLSQKAVDAYRRENPGSKLQTAVTEKKPTGKRKKRRANFCRRMKGMKSKLTSAKTARDPDSRINKALRRWNCH